MIPLPIRMVLVETSHPGNIGSTARAMKTMGLQELVLIDPKLFPHPKADEMSAGALDILEKATVVSSLDEALKGCRLVLATSARDRAFPWPMLTPKEAAQEVLSHAAHFPVAILFGTERSGLTNKELSVAQYHVHIPSDASYGALNLAQAVQVIAYEIRMAFLEKNQNVVIEAAPFDALPTHEQLIQFFSHFEETLEQLEFFSPNHKRQVMKRLIRFFQRGRIEQTEIRILRGILNTIQKNIHKKS